MREKITEKKNERKKREMIKNIKDRNEEGTEKKRKGSDKER